jgi:ABC-2 type transport system ATP-binding protein
MDEADELCDRVAFMNRGRVEALDTPQVLKKGMPQEQVLELKCLGDLNKEHFAQIKEFVSLNISKRDGYIYVRMNTANPEILLSKLVEAIRDKAKILSVNVTTPTLEDVFVYLTGASLKESQDE